MSDPSRPIPGDPAQDDGLTPVVDAAGRGLRAPWAAGAAGLLFAVLFTTALVLLRTSPLLESGDQDLARRLARGEDLGIVIGGLYCAPLAGIMFLWFVAVIRDQIGEREDRFFATVFLGSGVLFVAMLFTAAAAASAIIDRRSVRVRRFAAAGRRGLAHPWLRRTPSLFAFATRAAGVFLISTATIGLRTGVVPALVRADRVPPGVRAAGRRRRSGTG